MMLAPTSAKERPNKEKRSLAAILRRHGALSVADAIDIVLDICDELANAHANGLVHGDLGPHRVRLRWPRGPKEPLEIFALDEDDSAAFAFRASPVAPLTAPEQRAGRSVDHRADVWAVGAILHWMLAGRPPASGVTDASLVGVPAVVAGAIESCLAPDPAKRPQSVDEFAQTIGSYASSPPERFEALARRRAAREGAMRARAVRGDVSDVLGRLDDAAFARELVSSDGLTHTSVARSLADRILDPTGTSVVAPRPSLMEPKLPPPPRLPQLVEAPLTASEAELPVEKTVPLPSPIAAGSAPRRPDSLAPVSHPSSTFPTPTIDLRAHRRAAMAMGSAAALAFGLVVLVRMVGGGKPETNAAAQPPAAEPTPVVATALAPVVTSAPSTLAPSSDGVPVVSLESLPAFRPVRPHVAVPTPSVRASESARPVASAAPAPSASDEPKAEPKAEEPSTSDDAP